MSVDVRSKRAETVRPLHDEHCERQLVCDSVSSAKSDMNGVRQRETFVIQDSRLRANGEST